MSGEEIERRQRIFWSTTYLVTFLMWMYSFWPDINTPGDFFVSGFVAVLAAAMTFWIVGIGLAIQYIPVRILINTVRDLLGRRSGSDR